MRCRGCFRQGALLLPISLALGCVSELQGGTQPQESSELGTGQQDLGGPSIGDGGASPAMDGGAITPPPEPDAASPKPATPGIGTPGAPPTSTPTEVPPGPDCPRGIVTTDGTPANVRPTPSTSGAPLGTLPNGAWVTVLAIAKGEALGGVDTWYKVKTSALQGYLFVTLLKCTTQQPPTFDGFYLPFACGKKVLVTQGNSSTFSHSGASAYAFDFSLGVGTPMLAMAPGTVSYVYNLTKPGDLCYSGGGPSCIAKANQVWVKHPDGSQTVYAHLSAVSVALNQKVARAQQVGLSGGTGYSTGPHAHVARMQACCQSIPLKFNDVPGTGVPTTGSTVTSGNCP